MSENENESKNKVDEIFNFNIEKLNNLRRKGKSQRHAIKKAKGITDDLIKAAKGVIQKAIEISKQGGDNAGALIAALRTDFRSDVMNILKTGTDAMIENFEEKFSNKWVSEVSNHLDQNENIYKNIMMERVAPVIKKVIGLMDPIQALNYTDDQKVELAIDASIAIPNALFIAGITMYSKSLPLVMRLTGLVPPTVIANLETILGTIVCIFNNLKKFQELQENNKDKEDKDKEKWKKTPIENNAKFEQDGVSGTYDKKLDNGDWNCVSEGLKIADQNRREIDEQVRLIKLGEMRKKREEEAQKMADRIEKANQATEEAEKKGVLTPQAQGKLKTAKKLGLVPK